MNDRDVIALGILPAIYADFFLTCRDQGAGPHDEHWREGLAIDAYAMADAMIAIRSAKVKDAPLPGFGDMPKFPTIRNF